MRRFVVPVGLSLALLAGCGSSSKPVQEDRQFANNAHTTQTHIPTATTPAEPTGTTAPNQPSVSLDPAAPFGTRGAPRAAYLLNGNAITILDFSDGGTLRDVALALAPGELIREVAPSPSGDRAAVLIGDALWSPDSLRIALIDREGSTIAAPAPPGTPVASAVASLEASPVASAAASPAAGATPAASGDGTGAALANRPSTLSWSPDGESLVLTRSGSRIAIIKVAGDGTTLGEEIAIDPATGRLTGAWMSPRGDRVMVLLADARGGASIATIAVTGADRRPHVIWPGSDVRSSYSVRDAAWLPDGSGILFTRSDHPSSAGHLYEVLLSDLVPRVVATAGRAGPSGRIGTFVVSPDGKSVAYTLESPTSGSGTGWVFHSLWVRALRGGTAIELSTGDVRSTPIWTRAGLLWEENRRLVVAASGVDARVVATRPDDGPWQEDRRSATPEAASPVATPVASPRS